ncbi:MAG: hybrid sensor histidine kinase/response regulator [Pirellulales bacterium]
MTPDVLYVDDELDNLTVFEATFEDQFHVRCVTSAEEALAALERTPIPVVIADQRMPGISGVELLEILRQKHPHTKRIILTGYIDASAMLDAINQGQVYYFLTKPWQRETVAAVLIRALEAHRLELANSALMNQLVASQQLAMLGQATAKIVHEMSNQLCLAPLLEHIEHNYQHDPELMQLFQFTQGMYDRMSLLLNDLKAFLRSASRDCLMLPLSLSSTVQELVSFLRFDRRLSGVPIEVELIDDLTVCGHKVRLQQVLANLIKNAAYAIRDRDEGRIRVIVEKRQERALIHVEDNGCGIPAEIQNRIWDPSFTTKDAEGNGLGLDICRELVAAHQGEIWCESEAGCGSRFSISLPLNESTSHVAVAAANSTFAGTCSASNGF